MRADGRPLGQAVVADSCRNGAGLTDASARRTVRGPGPERGFPGGAATASRGDLSKSATFIGQGPSVSSRSAALERAKWIEASSALALSEGHFQRRLFGEAGGAAGELRAGLTASTIGRLKEVWGTFRRSAGKSATFRLRYVYFWADGIYFCARMEDDKQCVLVIVGATPWATRTSWHGTVIIAHRCDGLI